LQFNTVFPLTRSLKPKSYDVLFFYIFTTVETYISVTLDLVIKNGIILLREGCWLKVRVG